ncbi:hypothetical protein RZE82_05060 [Mollicutes bacterium LVI A0039]|nr:hypothetical protein RZE82_05060 [Mollicutes bacterium LVI A0039]
MSVSNLLLLLKTRNRYDITLLLFAVISLSLPLIKIEQTTISIVMQWAIVGVLFGSAIMLQATNQVGIKIPVFEYNLKLISHQQIKMLLVFKCSLYAMAIYYFITNLLVLDPQVVIVLKISLIFYVMLSCVSRSLSGYEFAVLAVLSGLAIKLPLLVVIIIHIVYYMSNRKLQLDFTSMYKLSLMANAVMLKTSSDITYKARGTKSKVLAWKFNKLTLIASRMINGIWYIIVPLILLVVIIEFTNSSINIVMLVIGASRVLFDKLTKEDLMLYRSKVIPTRVFNSMFKIDILILGLSMVLNLAIITVLNSFSFKWVLVLIITSIYLIIITPKEMSSIKIILLDSALITILSILIII